MQSEAKAASGQPADAGLPHDGRPSFSIEVGATMALGDLVPWGRQRGLASRRWGDDADPFVSLHREIDRMFDDFARGFGFGVPAGQGWGSSGGWPHVEVSEADGEVKVVAELPGMEQKDVELSLHDGVLTIKGEKKLENKAPVYSERWQGQFQRSIQIGPEVDPDKVGASFKDGVLTVTLPKRPEAQSQVKRIPISNA